MIASFLLLIATWIFTVCWEFMTCGKAGAGMTAGGFLGQLERFPWLGCYSRRIHRACPARRHTSANSFGCRASRRILYLPLSQRSLSFFLQLRHTRYQQTCFDCLSVLEKLSALLCTLHSYLGFLLPFVPSFLACIGAKQQLNQ